MVFRWIPIACLLLAIPGTAIPYTVMAQDQLDGAATAEMQKRFAEAYNRGDVDAMAAAFMEQAVRVTPTEKFQGRDAIRRSFQDALKLGLHDYSVQRVISRSEGPFVFNIGTWQAKLGDQPLRGYYTAILVRDGDQPKILEETVTVAIP
jgi:ketosteroid isomerase-like protein